MNEYESILFPRMSAAEHELYRGLFGLEAVPSNVRPAETEWMACLKPLRSPAPPKWGGHMWKSPRQKKVKVPAPALPNRMRQPARMRRRGHFARRNPLYVSAA